MNIKNWLLALFVFFVTLQVANAQEENTEKGFSFTYADLNLAVYTYDTSGGQESALWSDGTVQWSFNQYIGGFVYGCADKEFQCAYAGLTKEVADFGVFDTLEIGLGLGKAWYNDRSWNVINPWIYTEIGRFSLIVFGELIKAEVSSDEWFYRISGEYALGGRWSDFSVGFHAERWNGFGPELIYHKSDWWDIRFAWMPFGQSSEDGVALEPWHDRASGRLNLGFYW